MFERNTTKIRLGSGRVRYRTTIVCAQSEKDSMMGRETLRRLAELLSQQPELWLCGGASPDRISISYDNGRWASAAEAVVLEGD